MEIKFTMKGTVQMVMSECVEKMIEEFPMKFDDTKGNTHPVGVDMFKEDLTRKSPPDWRETFHHFETRILWVCERPRCDPQPMLTMSCVRVRAPGHNDWGKPAQLMKFMMATRKDMLTLSMDDTLEPGN